MTASRPAIGPVDSVEALLSSIASLSESNPGHLLLYRGQNNLHPTVRSRLSRPDVRYEPDVEQGLSAIAGNILGSDIITPRNIHFRKAVLQHYGYKTHYVDVTSDPVVAAWFSTSRFESHPLLYGGALTRRIEQVCYVTRTEGIGFVLVLAVPNAEALKARRRLFDISTLKPFLRPGRQKAWLLYDRKPLLPDPNEFWVATISVDCSKFKSELSSNYLFPLPTEDVGSLLSGENCVKWA
jgi:FRG domain